MSKDLASARIETLVTIDPENKVVTAVVGSETMPGYEGIGSARCMEEDRFSEEIGTTLAVARALKDMSRTLERTAFDEVHAIDEIRASQKRASLEALQRKRVHNYEFECEFAALINAKIAERQQADLDELAENTTPALNGQVTHPSTHFSNITYVNSEKKEEGWIPNPFRANLPG